MTKTGPVDLEPPVVGLPRREALRLIGAAISVPTLLGLSAEELLALGRGVHARLSDEAGLHIFKTLDSHQGATVAVLVDRILPATDTPGAAAVKAHEFVDVLLTEVLGAAERDRFLKGLVMLDRASRLRFGRDFLDCEPDQQIDLMKAQQDEATAVAASTPVEMSWGRPKTPKAHFFHLLKHMTLLAFYTSEPGLVGELGFVIVPGAYPGCPPRSQP